MFPLFKFSSTCIGALYLIFYILQDKGNISFMPGIWTAPHLPADGTWIHYVLVHPGLVLFLVLDTIILIAGTTLTSIQAYQVIDWRLLDL